MEVVVRGKKMHVSDELRALAQEKMGKADRFTHDVSRVEVEFIERRNPRIHDKFGCEVTVHLKRHFVKAHAGAPEPLAALDKVVDKVEHQLAKLKDKRVTRSHPRRKGLQSLDQSDYSDLVGEGEGNDDTLARVVKTKQFTMKPMGLEEAVLHLDLLGHDFYFFTNADNGRASVLYRRDDGDFGLIEATG